MSRKKRMIPSEGTREERVFHFEMRADHDDDHGDTVTGHPIVYDTPTEIHTYYGDYTEYIDRGALDGADLTDVPLLVNHNRGMIPVARSRANNANSSMQLTIDDSGMGFRTVLDTENNAKAAELFSAIKREDVTGMSFAFVVSGQKWEHLDSDHPVRHITAISRVLEISAVTWPAYESTSIEAEESRALESAGTALESAKAAYESEKRTRDIEILKLILEV